MMITINRQDCRKLPTCWIGKIRNFERLFLHFKRTRKYSIPVALQYKMSVKQWKSHHWNYWTIWCVCRNVAFASDVQDFGPNTNHKRSMAYTTGFALDLNNITQCETLRTNPRVHMRTYQYINLCYSNSNWILTYHIIILKWLLLLPYGVCKNSSVTLPHCISYRIEKNINYRIDNTCVCWK